MNDEVKVNSEVQDLSRKNGRFAPGHSGNPAGKPKNSLAEKLRKNLAGRADELLEVAIQQALDGDSSMIQFLLNRVVPSLKPQSMPLSLDLAGVTNLADLGNRLILACCDDSTGSPDTAVSVLAALGHLARVEEATELRTRIEELEKRLTS